jgi:1-acyl-sn-glycerol-3-phosphate acyltransferase
MSLAATIAGYTATLPAMLVALLLVGAQASVRSRALDGAVRFMVRALLLVFGVRIRVRGRLRSGESDACLFMANHVSILDPVILFAVLPRGTRGVELEDHFSWPVWGSITRLMGSIPISHRSTRSAVQSLRRAERVLAAGTPIVILPEGHRTRTGEMGRFMKGPFQLAHRTGVPIVPIALRGLYRIKNVHSLRVRPGIVEVAIGGPISAERYGTLSERETSLLVRGEIDALLRGGRAG